MQCSAVFRILCTFFFVGTSFSGCAPGTDAKHTSSNDKVVPLVPVEKVHYSGVIFPAVRGPETALMTGKTSTYWTPSLNDIEKMESRLRPALIGARDRPDLLVSGSQLSRGRVEFLRRELPKILNRLDDYRRQYVGTVIDGKRCIFANLVTEKEDALEGRIDWKKVFVWAEDGGYLYWQIGYNIDDDEFFAFSPNGYA